jgi:hypothetical protein
MKSENLTTAQIFGNFRYSQWCTFFGAISVLLSSGFWVGQKLTENQMSVQQADLRGAMAQLQVKLDTTQARNDTLNNLIVEWQKAYQNSQDTLARKIAETTQLSVQLGYDNNRAYIQKQIFDIRYDLEQTSAVIARTSNPNPDWIAAVKEQQAVRTKLIDGYQHQLAECDLKK